MDLEGWTRPQRSHRRPHRPRRRSPCARSAASFRLNTAARGVKPALAAWNASRVRQDGGGEGVSSTCTVRMSMGAG